AVPMSSWVTRLSRVRKETPMARSQRISFILLALLAVSTAGRPAFAQVRTCPQIEPYLTIVGVSNGVQNSVDQATLDIGGCVTLHFVVVLQPGGAKDVTLDPNTHYFSLYGHFTAKNVFCVSTADCNKQFPVYAVYHD